jgi:hypothetical protein
MTGLGRIRTLLQIACILALAVTFLAGCAGTQPTPTPEPVGSGDRYTSEHLDTSYEGALNASSQLALGTLLLEDTANAVTPAQAASLLPLWQALRAGTLQSEAETRAVLKQIEGTMTAQQLGSIAAMQLTWQELQDWVRSQGLPLGPGQGSRPQGQGQGQQISPEARETLRAQFGDQAPGPEAIATIRAQRGNMSEEEREALRATAEAGGAELGGRPFGERGFAAGQFAILLDPLIDLLTGRAAE